MKGNPLDNKVVNRDHNFHLSQDNTLVGSYGYDDFQSMVAICVFDDQALN